MVSDKLLCWQIVFITSLVISNVVSGKLVLLFDVFLVPSAVIAYSLTFLSTDIINELYGQKEAQKIVRYGLMAQILACILIYIAMILPVAPFMPDMQKTFEALLGQNIRFVIASLTAYYISQTNDIYSFNWLKKLTGKKYKWIRNSVSTVLSQILDTAIFITISFYGVVPNIWQMIVSQYTVKVIITIIDIPFFYYFTREKGR